MSVGGVGLRGHGVDDFAPHLYFKTGSNCPRPAIRTPQRMTAEEIYLISVCRGEGCVCVCVRGGADIHRHASVQERISSSDFCSLTSKNWVFSVSVKMLKRYRTHLTAEGRQTEKRVPPQECQV